MSNDNIIKILLNNNGKVPLKSFHEYYANLARKHQNKLTKPIGSLGRLEDFAIWMAGWQKRKKPKMDSFQCIIYAANHGVANKKVSAYPAEVTKQMVANF